MLPLYKTILIATDFTPNSQHAFKHAVMLARQNNAQIHLLHVIQQFESSMRGYLSSVIGESKLRELEINNLENARIELKKQLDEFARLELANFPEDMSRFAGSLVLTGNPVQVILDTADRIEADVLVIGTHGKGVIEHAFLGSVAEKVLRRSLRPVFTIPLPN